MMLISIYVFAVFVAITSFDFIIFLKFFTEISLEISISRSGNKLIVFWHIVIFNIGRLEKLDIGSTNNGLKFRKLCGY